MIINEYIKILALLKSNMKKIKLSKISTKAPDNITKVEALREIEVMKAEIFEMLRMFYAMKNKSLLIILQ